MDEGLEAMARCGFKRGLIEREVGENLRWDDIDWRIYDLFSGNVRTEYTGVAREIGVFPNTVKSRFLNKVMPPCVVANYFFPKGYDYYEQAFLRIHSRYEKDFIKILEKFPCMTYVFPLKKGLEAVP